MGWALEERPIWSKCVPERERERERKCACLRNYRITSDNHVIVPDSVALHHVHVCGHVQRTVLTKLHQPSPGRRHALELQSVGPVATLVTRRECHPPPTSPTPVRHAHVPPPKRPGHHVAGIGGEVESAGGTALPGGGPHGEPQAVPGGREGAGDGSAQGAVVQALAGGAGVWLPDHLALLAVHATFQWAATGLAGGAAFPVAGRGWIGA